MTAKEFRRIRRKVEFMKFNRGFAQIRRREEMRAKRMGRNFHPLRFIEV